MNLNQLEMIKENNQSKISEKLPALEAEDQSYMEMDAPLSDGDSYDQDQENEEFQEEFHDAQEHNPDEQNNTGSEEDEYLDFSDNEDF